MATQPLSKSEITHYTNLWCRQQGFKSRDLDQHPQMDDVVLLVQIIQEYIKETSKAQRIQLLLLWQRVYERAQPLKPKHYQSLERLVLRLEQWRYHRQQRQHLLRQRIKALKRTLP